MLPSVSKRGARNLYRFEVRVAQRRTNRRIDSLARGPVTLRLFLLPSSFFLLFFFFLRYSRAKKKYSPRSKKLELSSYRRESLRTELKNFIRLFFFLSVYLFQLIKLNRVIRPCDITGMIKL